MRRDRDPRGVRATLDTASLLVRGSTLGARTAYTLLALVVGAGILTTNLLHQDIVAQYDAALAAGGNVLVISDADDAIVAESCENLAARDDVRAAGWVRQPTVVHTTSAPGVGLMLAQVSPGAVQVLSGTALDVTAPGAILAREASTSIGATAGSLLSWENTTEVTVADIVDLQGRAPTMTRWILVPTTATGGVNECWVEAEEGHRGNLEDTIRASSAVTANSAIRALTDNPPEKSVDGTALRAHALAPVVLTLTSVLLLVLARLFERRSLAILSACGTQHAHLVQITAVVMTTSAAAATIVGLVLGVGVCAVQDVSLVAPGLRLVALDFGVLFAAAVALAAVRPANFLTTLRDE
ncbi:MAG: hypothetical protein FWH11_13350 [Micrococcales bacterium]|nr:hypothetical protein [Micrococcales bacterium]